MFSQILQLALELNLSDGGRSLCCESEAQAGLPALPDYLVYNTGFASTCRGSDEDWI